MVLLLSTSKRERGRNVLLLVLTSRFVRLGQPGRRLVRRQFPLLLFFVFRLLPGGTRLGKRFVWIRTRDAGHVEPSYHVNVMVGERTSCAVATRCCGTMIHTPRPYDECPRHPSLEPIVRSRTWKPRAS